MPIKAPRQERSGAENATGPDDGSGSEREDTLTSDHLQAGTNWLVTEAILTTDHTPNTAPSSKMPVPSIPIEKPADAVSPSPSEICTVKSSFWSGVGCDCEVPMPPMSNLPSRPVTLSRSWE